MAERGKERESQSDGVLEELTRKAQETERELEILKERIRDLQNQIQKQMKTSR